MPLLPKASLSNWHYKTKAPFSGALSLLLSFSFVLHVRHGLQIRVIWAANALSLILLFLNASSLLQNIHTNSCLL
jgi:hypothetical protein